MAGPMLVAAPEPSSPLWQRVKALGVEWPRTDEGVVSALAGDWQQGGRAFGRVSRHDVSAAGNAWQDGVGGTFVTRAAGTLGTAGEHARAMTVLAGRTAAFAREVGTVKTDISDHITANEGTFAMLGTFPAGIAGPAQDWFATRVAADVNQMISAGADRVTAMGDEPDDSVLDWINEQLGELGGDIGEAAGDFGGWLGGLPGDVGGIIGEQAAEAGDAVRDFFDGEDERLAAAAVDVNVDAITPESIWRDTDEPLFRSDDRGPDEVFDAGLGPLNAANLDLDDHVFNDNPSAFVSTSTDDELYRHPEYRDRDYRYIVRAPGGIDVGSTLPESRDRFPGENEVAFPGGVDTRYIVGAQRVNHDGTLGEWIQNPNFDPD